MTVLSLTAVSVRRGRRVIISGVSLRVEAGEVVAVLGPNGAGKSTLIHAIGGLLPASGSLARTGRVATVLQSPDLARRSVRANVELALAWWGVRRSDRRERADRALRAMRADHLARRAALTLSGGETRRVHLARGIALESDLLLLDEPFAGLDAATREELSVDTARALRAAGASALVVLHDRADAWAMADRVVVILEGRLAADGTPDELLAAPPSAEVARFLGYDGCLVEGDTMLLTRPPQVRLSPEGAISATVVAVRRTEDGARVHLRTATGDLHADHRGGVPAVGAEVRVDVRGGVRFPAGDAATDIGSARG